jgi:hypothetical protein
MMIAAMAAAVSAASILRLLSCGIGLSGRTTFKGGGGLLGAGTGAVARAVGPVKVTGFATTDSGAAVIVIGGAFWRPTE